MLIWIDLETTGLDPQRDHILEVAALATTEGRFEERWIYHAVVRRTDEELAQMDEYVFEMHKANGLLGDLLSVQIPCPEEEVRARLGKFVDLYGQTERGPSPLCGQSPQFDRGFLAAKWPEVASKLSHRNFDVTTLGYAASHLPGKDLPQPTATHRALDDIRHSVARCRSLLGVA